jgi:hypothetical protein
MFHHAQKPKPQQQLPCSHMQENVGKFSMITKRCGYHTVRQFFQNFDDDAVNRALFLSQFDMVHRGVDNHHRYALWLVYKCQRTHVTPTRTATPCKLCRTIPLPYNGFLSQHLTWNFSASLEYEIRLSFVKKTTSGKDFSLLKLAAPESTIGHATEWKWAAPLYIPVCPQTWVL